MEPDYSEFQGRDNNMLIRIGLYMYSTETLYLNWRVD